MRTTALLFALCCASANAADSPQAQIDVLQAALGVCQQQTGEANASALQKIATLIVQREALQKRVQELEEAAKKVETKR